MCENGKLLRGQRGVCVCVCECVRVSEGVFWLGCWVARLQHRAMVMYVCLGTEGYFSPDRSLSPSLSFSAAALKPYLRPTAV